MVVIRKVGEVGYAGSVSQEMMNRNRRPRRRAVRDVFTNWIGHTKFAALGENHYRHRSKLFRHRP